MKIKVSVPATSANIGSGFDALGLAVTLYNTVTFEESEVLDISSADGTRIPRGESNLVYRSAKGLFEKVGKQIPPLKITQTNPIPMARGLGSSSACIIAGLLGANRMLGDVLNTQELLTLATSIEGHPDNVAPALLGGLTSSVFEEGKVYSVKRNVDETLCFAAIVPDYKLLTEAARVQNRFQTLFEFATVLCAGDQGAQIQREDLPVFQVGRDIATHNSQCQTLCNGSFTDTRLTDQNRIVLGLSGEDSNDISYLIISADDRIQFSGTGTLHQILSVFRQDIIGFFRILCGNTLVATHFHQCLQKPLSPDPIPLIM